MLYFTTADKFLFTLAPNGLPRGKQVLKTWLNQVYTYTIQLMMEQWRKGFSQLKRECVCVFTLCRTSIQNAFRICLSLGFLPLRDTTTLSSSMLARYRYISILHRVTN